MILGPTNIPKDMRKYKIPKCKPLKQNSFEKVKRRKKNKGKKNLFVQIRKFFIMSQKSSKKVSTLSKHMANDANYNLIKIKLQTVLLFLF